MIHVGIFFAKKAKEDCDTFCKHRAQSSRGVRRLGYKRRLAAEGCLAFGSLTSRGGRHRSNPAQGVRVYVCAVAIPNNDTLLLCYETGLLQTLSCALLQMTECSLRTRRASPVGTTRINSKL